MVHSLILFIFRWIGKSLHGKRVHGSWLLLLMELTINTNVICSSNESTELPSLNLYLWEIFHMNSTKELSHTPVSQRWSLSSCNFFMLLYCKNKSATEISKPEVHGLSRVTWSDRWFDWHFAALDWSWTWRCSFYFAHFLSLQNNKHKNSKLWTGKKQCPTVR